MVRMLAPRLPLARTAIVRLPPKEADPYYLTPEWRELRRQTLERDGGVCTVPGCRRPAVVADHIVSRKEGGADALREERLDGVVHAIAEHGRSARAGRTD